MTEPGASGPISEAPQAQPVAGVPLPGGRRSTPLVVLSAVLAAAAVAIVVVVLVAALRHKSTKHPAAVTDTGPTTTLVNHPAPAPNGFQASTVSFVGADGKTYTWCLLLADVEPLRQQGLMWVTDTKLGGYDGMLFSWPASVTETFWMRNTPQPLSVAFFTGDGKFRSATDMDPCGDSASCPTYAATGPYLRALEVPKGRLPALSIGPGSKIVIEGSGKACGPASSQ